ncbi:hypothetical protein [Variovorax sp. N23]|uniref:hypothetical protein n=1 Tax=Variovorax sp. N23 TaxID=2980555 RepID=UPI0021C8965F|nr:hypothetical protein [Variovorax sp. N23]MCU4120945.1 hypothetical protein [Variovorax sp. N23]
MSSVAGISIVLFFVLFSWWSLHPDALTAARPWVETLNGATWPGDPDLARIRTDAPKRFAAAVALKTTFTFGGALGAILAALWLILGGLERLARMNLTKILEAHDMELINRLVMLLRQRHPQMLDGKDVEAMKAEARRLNEDFAQELEGV